MSLNFDVNVLLQYWLEGTIILYMFSEIVCVFTGV